MTEEIINADGSRNWEANILLDNIKRLEQENKELKELKCKFKEYCTCDTESYRSALEEIREMITVCGEEYKCKRCKFNNLCSEKDSLIPNVEEVILDKINEVLK